MLKYGYLWRRAVTCAIYRLRHMAINFQEIEIHTLFVKLHSAVYLSKYLKCNSC